MTKYKIVRHFQDGDNETIARDLTLRQAQKWCNDPQTSSRTATRPAALALTEARGPWFDGYTEQ